MSARKKEKPNKKLQPVTMSLFGKYDLKIASINDLFALLPKHVINKENPWRVENKTGDITMVVEGNRRLTIQDETVLLAILCLAAKPDLQQVNNHPWRLDGINPHGAMEKQIRGIRVTRFQLLKICGFGNSGSSYNRLSESLIRLSSARLSYFNKESNWRGEDWFITISECDDNDIVIFMNWRLSGGLSKDYHFICVDLDERLKLPHDYAKKLHLVLSHKIWNGKQDDFYLDTLAGYVWPDQKNEIDIKTIEARRTKLRRALICINQFKSWEISIQGRGHKSKAHIQRASLVSW